MKWRLNSVGSDLNGIARDLSKRFREHEVECVLSSIVNWKDGAQGRN